MTTLNPAAVHASRDAAIHCPDIWQAAMASAARRADRHGSDVSADAVALVAAFIPPAVRTGEVTLTGRDADRAAMGAARDAVARTLATIARESARSTSLDALEEADPGAVEHLTYGAARFGSPAAMSDRQPDPAARYDADALDRVSAALIAGTPDADPITRRALSEAVSAYLTAARADRDLRSGRLVSLPYAATHAAGIAHNTASARRHAAMVRAVLADAAPFLASVAADPLALTARRSLDTPTPATVAVGWSDESVTGADWSADRTPADAPSPWQPVASLADAAGQVAARPLDMSKAGRKAARARAAALPTVEHNRSSAVVSKRDGMVTVSTPAGHVLVTYAVADWTPALEATVLASLAYAATDDDGTAPIMLALGVTPQDAAAGERDASRVRHAPAKKATGKGKAGTGAAGPMVPDRPARPGTPRYVMHPDTVPAVRDADCPDA